jgi:hypothetical protein|nr:MAG TPA: hypothetical protein [Caudoviricetes sp.]
MQISDIEGLLRSHLLEGETMVEEPSDYFDDRMYTITTAALPVHAYTIRASGLYAVGAEGALEVWSPEDGTADRAIDAVLGHARRNGAPPPPPDPEKVFADAIAYLRPLMREGEALSTSTGRNGDLVLTVSGPAGSGSVLWNTGLFRYISPLEPGYNDVADSEEEIERLLRRALDEARNPIDFDSFPHGNH